MTTNETIARWLGLPIVTKAEWTSWIEGECEGIMEAADLALRADGRLEDLSTGDGRLYEPDRFIDYWHGDDGILQKIEEKGAQFAFIKALADILYAPRWVNADIWGALWLVRRADAPQLAAALLKCIEGESHA